MDALKLYVWTGVLYDYESGIMFALAHSREEARELILKAMPWIPDEEFGGEPKVFDTPIGFALSGGQ